MENKNIITGIVLLAILICFVIAIFIISGSGIPNADPPFNPGQGRGCTMDAKICPDGSTVGRVGSNCEFEECPAYVFDRSKFCPDYGNCQDMGSESRMCRVIGDCAASCGFGCVSREWMDGKIDCEAMWANFKCECINNICQRI